MRSLPMHLCHGNPRSQDAQEPSAADLTNPQESEHAGDSADRGFSLRYFHISGKHMKETATAQPQKTNCACLISTRKWFLVENKYHFLFHQSSSGEILNTLLAHTVVIDSLTT